MRNKKAISLIVLVITIIVMIILASVIIMSLDNANIFNKAEEVVDKYTDLQLQQEVEIIFANAQLEKYMNNNYSIENELKNLFENKYGKDNVTVNVNNVRKSYKVKVKGSKTTFRIKADGSIEEYEEMEPTNIYARLDDEGTLYLRATNLDNRYKTYINSDSIKADWNTTGDATKASVLKIIIEEPIAPTTMNTMFWNYTNLTSIEKIDNIHTENVIDMSHLFNYCLKLSSIDLTSFDTSNVQNMNSMFYSCKSLTSVNVSNFYTENVTDMNNMFSECTSLTEVDVNNFDTQNVIDMNNMFNQCFALLKVDISNYDTSKLKSMQCMFNGCYNLANINIGNINTESLINTNGMFSSCKKLSKIDIRWLNTKNVNDMKLMFYNCEQLKELVLGSLFVIENNTNIENILNNVPSDIKITATEATRDKMISVSTLTNSNFEIIN